MTRILLLATLALTGCNAGIITMGNDPNVVYVQGEMCTINATPDIDPEYFLHMATWCVSQHQQFLNQQ